MRQLAAKYLATAVAVAAALALGAMSGLRAEPGDGADGCVCATGPCCDGCQLLGPAHVCADPGAEETMCESDGCGAALLRRRAVRFCSGVSAGCEGDLGPFGPWEPQTFCGDDELCSPEPPHCRAAVGCGWWIRCDDDDPSTRDGVGADGACIHTPIDCDDGDACTEDRILDGVCVHAPTFCDDYDPCTNDACDTLVGCVHEPVDGALCQNAGGADGVCLGGACCVPDCAGRQCGADGCGGSCGPCSDSDACTVDVCGDDGLCRFDPIPVDDGVDCTIDTCQDGWLSHTPQHSRCDDGRACSWEGCTPSGCARNLEACDCAEDAHEDNDDASAPAALWPNELTEELQARYGDDDWWSLTVPADERYEIVLTADPWVLAAGELALRVLAPCGDPLPVVVANGTARVESVAPIREQEQRALVRVTVAGPGGCYAYRLRGSLLGPAEPLPTCNVPCPRLDGYPVVYCNEQDHCEYARAEPAPWQTTDVLIWVPPGPFPFGPPGEEVTITFPEGYWVDKYEAAGGAYAVYMEEHGGLDCPDAVHGGTSWCVNEFCWLWWGWDDVTTCSVVWDDTLEQVYLPHRCSREWRGPLTTCQDHAVSAVPWMAAQGFCHWMGKELCSEAQWERAGKGTTQRNFPWGDGPIPGEEGWDDTIAFLGTRGENPAYDGWSPPVYGLPTGVSPVGCHQMAGGVREWVLDHLDNAHWPHQVPSDGSAFLDSDPEYRVIRGMDTNYDAGLSAFHGRWGGRILQLFGDPPYVLGGHSAWPFADRGFGLRCCRAARCKE